MNPTPASRAVGGEDSSEGSVSPDARELQRRRTEDVLFGSDAPAGPGGDADDDVLTSDMVLEDESAASAVGEHTVWPANVPSAREAQELLLHVHLEGALGEVSRALMAEASEPERMLLGTEDIPEELRLLKAALLQRWRLAAAIRLAPVSAQDPVDREAFDALLSESDVLLQGLGASEGLSLAMQESLASARSYLARDLVSLTERVPALVAGTFAQPAAVAPAPVAPRGLAKQARLISMETGAVKPSRRMEPLQWVLVAALVIAGGFHGVTLFLRPAHNGFETPAGWPEGTVHTRGRPGGPRFDLYVVPPGQQVSESALSSLRSDAAAQGLEVQQASPQTYLVHPAAPPAKAKGEGK